MVIIQIPLYYNKVEGCDKNILVFGHSVTNVEVFFFLVADAGVLAATLTGHTDAIWGLAFHGPRQQLLSSSSDGTVKLW